MIFFFKQKTAYEMRISDWSSDVCSSDLHESAEINEVDDLAVVDLANFRFLDNAKDQGLRSLDLRKVGRADLDNAFIVNVDLRAGLRDDFADDLAARADDNSEERRVGKDGVRMCRSRCSHNT